MLPPALVIELPCVLVRASPSPCRLEIIWPADSVPSQ